ncbi:sugar ABC transporter substrate-binding protein [Crocosphaera sp. XPORK-15E]|uniref:sugar ABC transporter substrate-binding protein n=1 Tax=Crocosphaera sp. XPORK-15E TaxID=3110247 RepID=UPI002B21A1E9|nr:sugar ABC transporter substrate-binding protein [Crocosphaera sp. XPORK-15E]MEA5536552.1 sugar ABC transporter substrate-binding protein [Crocosphaera sp. XPORK-15E]
MILKSFKSIHKRPILSQFKLIWLSLLIGINSLLAACQTPNQSSILTQNQEKNPSEFSQHKLCQPLDVDSIKERLKPTKPWRIGYLLKTSSDPFWQRIDQGIKEISQDFGIQGIVKYTADKPDTKGDVKNQILLILDLIENKKVDGLIIAPEDSIQLIPVVEKATEEGIPVIIIDTPIDTKEILTFVSFDNFQAGKMMGKWVIQQLEKSHASEGNVNVLILEGSLHEENTVERRQGFLEGLKTLKKANNLDILDMKPANWETSKAKKITAAWLDKFPDIDVIMAADDQMAIGASQAVAEAQRTGIIITGFDGMNQGLNAIKAGKIHATVNQIPEIQVKLTTQLMIDYLEGKKQQFPPCQLIWENHTEASLLITFENIDQYLK